MSLSIDFPLKFPIKISQTILYTYKKNLTSFLVQHSQQAREQGLAQSTHDKDMAGVVKEITYGDLWGAKHGAHSKDEHHGTSLIRFDFVIFSQRS